MTISLLGIIMVLVTIGIGGYLLFQALSSTISTDVGSGTSYDKIAALKADYNSLNSQYAQTKISIEKMNNKNATTSYDLAELELISAQTDIADAESAITAKKSSDEINSRIEQAQKQLVVANQALKDLQAEYL
jgi:predicted  nucleic acid-binding Zn-ribbon protein